MGERVLVCILGQTRAHEATWAGFRRHVVDALGADLALCIGIDGQYDRSNPFWQTARYRWTAVEPADFGPGFDEAREWFLRRGARRPDGDWRGLIAVTDQWLGGIAGPRAHPGSAGILIYFRWLLYRHLIEGTVLKSYDRIIVTRSDFLWEVPHPPLHLLDPSCLWLPDGERYGGLTDRHIVASSADILPAINLMEEIVLQPGAMTRSMAATDNWNVEKVIRRHFDRTGLTQRTRFFPYVMYAVRGRSDRTRWSAGTFDEELGLYVKYQSERDAAGRYRAVRSAADWEALIAADPSILHGNAGPPLPAARHGLRARLADIAWRLRARLGRP